MFDLDLTRTRAAIAQFREDEARLFAELENVQTNADVLVWDAKWKAAADKVRLAYYEDTSDRNQAKTVMQMHTGDIIRFAETGPGQ